jgi:hypothetical protein
VKSPVFPAKQIWFGNQTKVMLEQWSTGLGLSRPMDKPVAKCSLCERELRKPNISRSYVEWVYRIQKFSSSSQQPRSLFPVHSRRNPSFRFRRPSACPRPGGAVEAGSCQPGLVSGGEMRVIEALGAKSGLERRRSRVFMARVIMVPLCD